MSPDNSINIRSAEQKDLVEIRELLRTTWYDAYDFIPKEDLDWYLDANYSDVKLKELLKTDREECFVYDDGALSGWMRLRLDDDNNIFSIISLYVLPSHQGKGIGKQLLNFACEFALEYRFEKVTLGVMTQNEKSAKWYKDQGFEVIGKEPFIMGKTEVEHLIMEKVIFFQ
jgi:ribosomal protein S18 acetylase RimI-like enzyme